MFNSLQQLKKPPLLSALVSPMLVLRMDGVRSPVESVLAEKVILRVGEGPMLLIANQGWTTNPISIASTTTNLGSML